MDEEKRQRGLSLLKTIERKFIVLDNQNIERAPMKLEKEYESDVFEDTKMNIAIIMNRYDLELLKELQVRGDIFNLYRREGRYILFNTYPIFTTTELEEGQFKLVSDLEPLIERRKEPIDERERRDRMPQGIIL